MLLLANDPGLLSGPLENIPKNQWERYTTILRSIPLEFMRTLRSESPRESRTSCWAFPTRRTSGRQGGSTPGVKQRVLPQPRLCCFKCPGGTNHIRPQKENHSAQGPDQYSNSVGRARLLIDKLENTAHLHSQGL
jgi:hypothetical protein